MSHRLFTLASVVSLLLCAVCAFMWVRSYWVVDRYRGITQTDEAGGARRTIIRSHFSSTRGSVGGSRSSTSVEGPEAELVISTFGGAGPRPHKLGWQSSRPNPMSASDPSDPPPIRCGYGWALFFATDAPNHRRFGRLAPIGSRSQWVRKIVRPSQPSRA